MGLFDRNPEGGALAAPMVQAPGGGGGGITWADPVDSNITFDAHDTYAIGAPALAPSSVYAGSGGFVTDDGAGINTSVYQGGMGSINATNQFWIELYSNTDPDGASNVHGKIYTDGGATPSLDIFSAEKLWLRATSNIALYSGAASTFRFQKTGVSNSVGDVWTATGTNGEGYWAAPGGGGGVLANDTYFQARNFANTTDVGLFKFNASDELEIGDGYLNIKVVSPMRVNSVAFFDGTYTATVYVQSSTLTADYSLILPVDDGAAGQVLSTDGSGILSWVTAASGANTALSNLGITSINISLLPSASNARDLGASSSRWRDLYLRDIFTYTSTGTDATWIRGTTLSTPGGSSVDGAIQKATNSATALALFTPNKAGTGATGSILLETGNVTSGAFNSGDISLLVGTSSGTRGSITMSARVISLAADDVINYNATAGKHDFASTGRGIVVPRVTADPGSPENGEIWYNTTSTQLKAYVNGSTVVLA